jgi:hypothetical protein
MVRDLQEGLLRNQATIAPTYCQIHQHTSQRQAASHLHQAIRRKSKSRVYQSRTVHTRYIVLLHLELQLGLVDILQHNLTAAEKTKMVANASNNGIQISLEIAGGKIGFGQRKCCLLHDFPHQSLCLGK